MALVRPDDSPSTPQKQAQPPLDLDALYRAHASTVARWAARLGGPRLDAEDMVHEVFLVAKRRLPDFRGEAKVTTWLYRITARVVRDRRRRERRRHWFARAFRSDVERAVAVPYVTPVEALERRQASDAVYEILDGMPDKYRNVLVLFELEEMSGEEIAALTGLKLPTVWVHLHRARARFLADMKRRRQEEP
jgi:RNA polymerase sigma-70 factor (ECF subfamily)